MATLLMVNQNRPSYTLKIIPNGVAGTKATLDIMSGLVKTYKKSPFIRELAIKLTNNQSQKNWIGEIKAIHRFVKNQIRYVKDIRGVETLQTPVQTLRLKAGDCDDKSTLIAALLESIGHPTRFKAVGFLPNTYNHVYPETKVGGKWLTVECTEPVKVGWQPKGIKAVLMRNN